MWVEAGKNDDNLWNKIPNTSIIDGTGNGYGQNRKSNFVSVVSENGQPIRFSLTGGQCHDMTEVKTLLEDFRPQYVIADKGYDSDPLRQRSSLSRRTSGIPNG